MVNGACEIALTVRTQCHTLLKQSILFLKLLSAGAALLVACQQTQGDGWWRSGARMDRPPGAGRHAPGERCEGNGSGALDRSRRLDRPIARAGSDGRRAQRKPVWDGPLAGPARAEAPRHGVSRGRLRRSLLGRAGRRCRAVAGRCAASECLAALRAQPGTCHTRPAPARSSAGPRASCRGSSTGSWPPL